MTTQTEALKLALEALQSGDYWKGVAAVNAIKEALAQPEQEPVATGTEWFEYWNAVDGWVSVPLATRPFAWAKLDELAQHMTSVGCGTVYYSSGEGRLPLYTTPPQRKPLTQDFEAPLTLNGVAVYPRQKPLYYEQIKAIWDEPETTPDYGFARAIEAAHGIKE